MGNSYKKTSIGGQALIEGVMMRGPEVTAMAVRHESGKIVVEKWQTQGTKKPKFCKLPFIRGIFNMIDSMRYGYKCLMHSAEVACMEEDKLPAVTDAPVTEENGVAGEKVAVSEMVMEPTEHAKEILGKRIVTHETEQPASAEASVATATATADSDKKAADDKKSKNKEKFESFLMTLTMILSSVLGIAIAVVLFMWLPVQLSRMLENVAPFMKNFALKSIFEGLIRIVIFLAYISLVSCMKDIRRVFQYHGSEHKTIFCYEHGLELTVENVRKQRRFHPRCGTSFMVLMLLVGIFISMLIPIREPIPRACIKLLTLPIVVGIGYELIKLAGRKDNLFTRIISAPGLWVQRITTKEPDDSMIECAIAAFKPVIPDDPEADRW